MENEIFSLAAVIILGGILGVLFDVYRIIHYIFKPRTTVVWLLDFIYTAIIIAVGFVTLLLVNWAEFRLYIYLGIICGAAAYFYWLSRFVYRLLRCLADRLLKLWSICWRFWRKTMQIIKNKVAKRS